MRLATNPLVILMPVLASLLLVGCAQIGSPSIDSSTPELDRLLALRSVEGISRLLTPDSPGGRKPLNVLKTNGVYDTGRHGWKAIDLTTPSGQKYVVFSTPLTVEDIGEFVFERRGQRLKLVPETLTMGVKIAKHSFNVRFAPAKQQVHIVDEVSFKAEAGQGDFIVRMGPEMRVSKATSSGRPVPFSQAGGVVALPRSPTASFSITLDYSGTLTMKGYAGSITSKEAQLTNGYWYPLIGRLPAAYDMTVRTPREWTAVGQGERLSEKVEGLEKVTKLDMKLPVIYFSFSAGPYKTAKRQVGERKFSIWSSVMTDPKMQAQIEFNAPILAFFEKSFGKYPFSEWGVLESEVYGNGALEAYSYATYGTGWLPAIDAHEPSHSWFGGIINNTYLKSLWNESFAAFAEGFYARETSTGLAGESRLAFIDDALPNPAYNASPAASAGASIGSAAAEIGYGKGAKVLQMLEFELGTELFLKCVREWLATHPKGKPGEWEDFEAVVNGLAKKPMQPFFDQWLRLPGWPRLDVRDVKWANGAVTGTLHFAGPAYAMRMEAMMQYPNGKREFARFNSLDKPEKGAYRFAIQCQSPERPMLISIDPYRRLLRDVEPDEEPVSLRSTKISRRYTDPANKGWLPHAQYPAVASLPKDLDGVLIVASPDTTPAMAALCAKAGFFVDGNRLIYRETEIDLRKGGAMAVVELGAGKRCVIGLGTSSYEPEPGRARTIVFDHLGRFLRAQTDPKTAGKMAIPLGGSRALPGGVPIK